MSLVRIRSSLEFRARRLARAGVDRGLPASWFRYTWVRTRSVDRIAERSPHLQVEVLQDPAVARHPLPANWPERERLPADAGWWGYSFRDVPERRSGRTALLQLRDATVLPATDRKGQFWAAVLTRDGVHLDLRELAFRPLHVPVIRSAPVQSFDRATWICERSYHNYSHWFTAHLPKLLFLHQQGELGTVLLPPDPPAFVLDSLRLWGLPEASFRRFRTGHKLRIGHLTLLETDRFRPELLRLVREGAPEMNSSHRQRRIFISRDGATRRCLRGETGLWPLLRDHDFEIVRMEDLDLERQVRLMQETAVLVGPHGAGLTNMIFCAAGTRVVELANLDFPNPNFYALASAMGHAYWLVPARARGEGHPLDQDLEVAPGVLAAVLQKLDSAPATA